MDLRLSVFRRVGVSRLDWKETVKNDIKGVLDRRRLQYSALRILYVDVEFQYYSTLEPTDVNSLSKSKKIKALWRAFEGEEGERRERRSFSSSAHYCTRPAVFHAQHANSRRHQKKALSVSHSLYRICLSDTKTKDSIVSQSKTT